MKTLATLITKKKLTYTQILREGMLAIYSQQDAEGHKLAYEVIKIKSAPAHERGGVAFPAMELYPSDEQFGLNGWSYGVFGKNSTRAYSKALDKFKQLQNTQLQNENTES